MSDELKTVYFDQWHYAARARATDWWHECRRRSTARAERGEPTLEEMWNAYETLRACGGGEFDPVTLRPDEDALVDTINEEIVARMTLQRCIEKEIDRVLKNRTHEVLAGADKVSTN